MMKYSYIMIAILSISLPCSNSAFSQVMEMGVYNVNGVKYKVDRIANETVTIVIPRDTEVQPDNPETVDGMPTEILIQGLIVRRYDDWFKYAKETLSTSRISQLNANNDWIRFHYYLKSDGTCFYGSFNLNSSSSLTLREIAAMYMHIKSNFKPCLMSLDARHLQLSWIPVDGGRQIF